MLKLFFLFTTLLTTLPLLSVSQSFDAENEKVIEPGKRWIYAIGRTVPMPEVDRHEALFIGEDTVISNHEYFKLYLQGNIDKEQIRLLGFIRETENKRIYYLPVKEEKEELLYDFNLIPGDSIYLNRYNTYLYMDSINMNVNHKKVYHVRLGNRNIQWIENVGSNIGVLMMETVGGFRIFTCCYKGDSLIYRNPRFSSCDLTKMEYLVSENKLWSNVIHYKTKPNIGSEFLKLSGDTVIDKNIYKKVLRSTDEHQNTWNCCGFIRGTLEQKVYYRTDNSKQEYLLYDFSAQLDDTLKLYRLFTGQKQELKELTFRVSKTDSVLIGNEYRKQFEVTFLNEPDNKEYFIEGIGSLNGLLYWKGGFVGMDDYELNCFFEDSVLNYHNNEYPSCYYTWTSAEQIPKDETLITIIPVGNETAIVRSLNGGGRLQIYDLTGKAILQKTLKSDETQICLPASGVYISHFKGDNGKIQIGKIVVN